MAFVRRHLLLILLIIFILIIGGGYIAGYRPGPGLTFVRVGTLVVDDLPTGTTVYADLTSRGITKGTSMAIALVPGSHSIIVDAPNMQPYEKIVSITSNETTHISPILVGKTPEKQGVFGPGTKAIIAAAATTTLPTENSPLTLDCEQIYVSDNRVIASPLAAGATCTPPSYLCTGGACAPTVVYPPANALTSLVPFPGRTDSIIVTVADWVYVLGLDPENPQYFAPLAHGTAPIVLPESTSSVYVVDQGSVYSFPF